MKKKDWFMICLCMLFTYSIQVNAAGSIVSEAEGSETFHKVGKLDGDGWSASIAQDNAGYLAHGPYAINIPSGKIAVTYRMMSDSITSSQKVVTIDVYDANSQKVLGTRDILCKEFYKSRAYQDFTISVDNPANSRLEFRVYWYDISYVKIDKIIERKADEVLLLVGTATNTQLKNEILQFKNDVELHAPVSLTIQDGDWKTADDVRKVIKDTYAAKGITGVVLVGNVPMHKFYMHEGINPNPMYYEAFDIAYNDKNGDGVHDAYVWKSNMMKIWVANIRAVVSATDLGIDGLRTFFTKTHNYYIGNQSIARRCLSVAGSDWKGSAAWFGNTYAKPILGSAGDILDGTAGTKDTVLKLFAAHKYTLCRLWLHSNESASDLENGDIYANEIYNLPNKSLITFHLGCYNSSWMRNSSGSKNNGMSWVFSPGVGQALVGGVRSGTLYQENILYDKLVAGKYLGPAYLSCKSAGEQEMHGEYADGTVITGNLLLGNPFLQVASLSEIIQPISKPTAGSTAEKNHLSVHNNIKSWGIESRKNEIVINSPITSQAQIVLQNASGRVVAKVYSGHLECGVHSFALPAVSNGLYLLTVQNVNSKHVFKQPVTIMK
jgi:hypothetical protein